MTPEQRWKMSEDEKKRRIEATKKRFDRYMKRTRRNRGTTKPPEPQTRREVFNWWKVGFFVLLLIIAAYFLKR